jgi:Trypsin
MLMFCSYKVRLGEWDTSTEHDCDSNNSPEVKDCVDQRVQDITIEKIIQHDGFIKTAAYVHNDIALLRLNRPAVFNKYVQPICLPRSEKLLTAQLDNSSVQVAGWGFFKNFTESKIKMKSSMKVMPTAQCNQTNDMIYKQFCAYGEKTQDSCKTTQGGRYCRRKKNRGVAVVGRNLYRH